MRSICDYISNILKWVYKTYYCLLKIQKSEWWIYAAKTFTSENNYPSGYKTLFTEVMGKKKVLIDFEIFTTWGICLRLVWDLGKVWFAKGVMPDNSIIFKDNLTTE